MVLLLGRVPGGGTRGSRVDVMGTTLVAEYEKVNLGGVGDGVMGEMEHAATVRALWLPRDRTAAEAAARSRDDLIGDLALATLSGAPRPGSAHYG